VLVVDTNVLGYLFIEGDFSRNARALLEYDSDWHSEPFILVELTNVFATEIRVRRASLRDAMLALTHAQVVIEPGFYRARHADVLSLAIEFKVSAYDARFLAVARALGVPLVTEDVKLRKAAPPLTQSIAQALAA
jgi:predicted nucleic acid-binding protein